MTALPPSSSEFEQESRGRSSSGFARLHAKVQQWVWEQGWTDLRDVQELAIEPILEGGQDVIIAAATAGGKTEAAFLPICSSICNQPSTSVRVLYVSPLKALINDQFDRLDRLCERLDIPVHRWHGDVSSSQKHKVLSEPSGILLITPESLEAMFVLRGTILPQVFATLGHIVVDELHSFIGSERGKQLQSLLGRIELVVRRRVPRVALSATLGDMDMAADFLRPDGALPCRVLVSNESRQEIRLQIRGYHVRAPSTSDQATAEIDPLQGAAVSMIGADLFNALRGTDNLIFANSRRNVEEYGDHLRRLSERERVPNEFWPHHGSLAKHLREHAESALKDPGVPASVVCTSTLEMGIDIGSITSVAQIGAPFSVAGLRQRLGRSGRRGEPSIVRMYISEPELSPGSPPQEQVRPELVEAVAMVRLLVDKWCEPPAAKALHLSTLVQQVLSLIAQHGGCKATEAWNVLCRAGAFPEVRESVFGSLLRALGENDLIMQASDGTLLLGVRGERLVNHYSFYSAFVTPEEYHIVADGRELGTLPISRPLQLESYIIFAGRRWRVNGIDEVRRSLYVVPAPAGRAPKFSGGSTDRHDRVRQEMKLVYESSDLPGYLDPGARALLLDGRDAFARYGLSSHPFVEYAGKTAIFFWMGDRIMNTLLVQLRDRKLDAALDGIALVVDRIGVSDLERELTTIAAEGPADPLELARTVANKRNEKHHPYLDDELVAMDYASARFDTEGAWQALLRVAAWKPGCDDGRTQRFLS